MQLTEPQSDAIARATAPLEPLQRQAFLTELLELIRGRVSVGDGELYRSLRELQRTHHVYPTLHGLEPNHSLKTKRGYVK
jgi:hypothetical protein